MRARDDAIARAAETATARPNVDLRRMSLCVQPESVVHRTAASLVYTHVEGAVARMTVGATSAVHRVRAEATEAP